MDQLLTLAPACRVIVRDIDQLQFGLDSTRSGIIRLPPPVEAAQVATAMSTLAVATPYHRVMSRLRATGLSAGMAAAIIDDLVAFRVLREAVPLRVAMLGHGAVAAHTSRVLTHMGLEVQRPEPEQPLGEFLEALAESQVVVLCEFSAAHSDLLSMLSAHVRTWVPGTVMDARGVVGPLRINGHGPCPMCVALHRADIDPRWGFIARQEAEAGGTTDPAAVAATAATLAVTTASLAGVPDPPGVQRAVLRPGAVIEVDPAGYFRHYELQRHRLCPVCFYLN